VPRSRYASIKTENPSGERSVRDMQQSLRSRAAAYARVPEPLLGPQLGAGQDGAVWATARDPAIKAFEREDRYLCELKSYQRLTERSTTNLKGFAIPAFKGADDSLLVIEMGLVVSSISARFRKGLRRPAATLL
jgi:hypothetical protein